MDQATKRQLVEAIDKEVGELHPLLDEILRGLANVQYVEYTHGPNEMGADFVLERRDESLGETDHIGVVAKCDKILQSFADVERQIDECGDPRLIKNGLLEVRLPEVWVITSKSVSHNAKSRIQEKFKSKKIRFFDSDWLVDKIDEHAPHFWQSVDGAVGRYLAALDKRLGIISTQTSVAATPMIGSIEMEVDVEEVDVDRYAHKTSQRRIHLVNVREEVVDNKVTVIEAQMGFGKSHLARRTAMHFADVGTFKKSGVLPVFASFKSFADRGMSAEAFIRSQVGDDCYDRQQELGGRVLLILDGVDESLADPEACKTKIDQLIREVKGRAELSLILTTRPWKTIDELAAQHSGVKKYRIRPLSIGKIVAYLRRVFTTLQLPDRLLDDLAKSGLFKQLPHNPIAAALLANIIKQEKYELPSSLTELYAKTVELMLGRWDERRQISTERQYKANERLARLLARHMIDNQLVYMSRSEIKQMFQNFLSERQTGVSLEETFDYLITRSSMFGTFEDTDAVFFKHRSFAEYLYARDAYEARNLEISNRAFDAYWLNIYFFFIGTRSECPDLIDALVALDPQEVSQRVHRLLNMGNYMLAGYETPYVHIERALDALLLEAAKLYLDVRHGRIPSGLTDLTEMQLLWYFTAAVRHCYGYEFFRRALPLTIAQIEEKVGTSDESRPYALFFAACSLAETGDTSGFSYLLNHESVTTLPMPVSFALRFEMENAGRDFAHSKPVKEFDRKLKKILRTGKDGKIDFDNRLKLLFHQPLSAKAKAVPGKSDPKVNGKTGGGK